MERRQLGSGAKVFTFSGLDPEHRQQPTEDQVRDAIGRLSRDLNDLALARGDGWIVEDLNPSEMFTPEGGWFLLDDGTDLVLRGTIIIRRAD